jgi:hypothetical protein
MPRTSVIIPLHDAAPTAHAAIASVLAQSDDDLEIVAVDDGSRDGTADVVATIRDPRLRLIRHARNRGVSAARNSGLAAASGEFVAFLDADDTWEPTFLASVHGARGDADAVVCGRTVVLPDASVRTEHSARLGVLSGSEAAEEMMIGGITPFPWDKVIRRRMFDGLAYPEDVHRFEDQVVGVLALARARTVVSVPDALIRYHVAAGSLTWGRAPEPAETEHALEVLREGLGGWVKPGRRMRAFETCRTMFFMLTAQSAMRSPDAADARAAVAWCRARISWRMMALTLRTRPVIGVGAVLLKALPGAYRSLFQAYVRRRYALR